MMVLLDNEKIGNRRTRGLIGISVMGTVTTAGWIGLAGIVEASECRNAKAKTLTNLLFSLARQTSFGHVSSTSLGLE